VAAAKPTLARERAGPLLIVMYESRTAGDPVPRSAREAAERIGWQAHTVAKRCENIRNRYVRLGVPGLRGPRALEELAQLLVATGELTPADLRRLPASS